VMALVLLLLVTQVPLGATLGLPLWAGIGVVVTVFIVVIAAKWPMLSDIPASFYGFASVVALALVGGKLAVTTVSLDNPFINIVISLVIGAALGYVSQKVALALAKK